MRAITEGIKSILFDHSKFYIVFPCILLAELVGGLVIIWKVPYTEIDWKAYMQEVGLESGFLSGQWNYEHLKGDTGPLVYPAGFVYIYSILYYVTSRGANILLAQYIFLVVYLLFISVVFLIYHKTQFIPPWAFILLCISKRIHSLFMLRLFNDCLAMLALYLAIYFFVHNRWSIGCFLFSVGVSIKMNILLFSPALLIFLFKRFNFVETISKLVICASVQVILGTPFLVYYPIQYFHGAFEFGRKFTYKWTVNLKMVPEHLFNHPYLALGLLIAHLVFLLILLNKSEKWGLYKGIWKDRVWPSLKITLRQGKDISLNFNPFSSAELVGALFVSNFVGIVFSRSLHFQFYVWYYHSLPFLLWICPFPTPLRIGILLAVEVIWNIYPSTPITSVILCILHLIILFGLFFGLPLSTNILPTSQNISKKIPTKTKKGH